MDIYTKSYLNDKESEKLETKSQKYIHTNI